MIPVLIMGKGRVALYLKEKDRQVCKKLVSVLISFYNGNKIKIKLLY